MMDDVIVPDLIWSYLVHNGYSASANSFLRSRASQGNNDKFTRSIGFTTMAQRAGKHKTSIHGLSFVELTKKIINGQIEEAIELVNNDFSFLVGDTNGLQPDVSYFSLLCQFFVELIRERRANEALDFAEKRLSALACQYPIFAKDLQVQYNL